jgi:hypothetical protein
MTTQLLNMKLGSFWAPVPDRCLEISHGKLESIRRCSDVQLAHRWSRRCLLSSDIRAPLRQLGADIPWLESYVADGRRTSSEVREVPQPDCGRKRNSLAQERRLAMNTSAAADALDQGDTDRARIRVRTGRLVLCIAREPSWLADGPKRGYGPEQPLAALSSCRHHSLRRGPPP